MLFRGKIRVVEEYMTDNHIVGVLPPKRHSEFRLVLRALGSRVQEGHDLILRTPSVATLTEPVGYAKKGVKFSRFNVFARDGFRCMYCGESKTVNSLNFDHVIPRQKGGVTDWDNIVTSCYPCNFRKRNRTPEQAGMKLIRKPVKPKFLPLTGPRINYKEVPENWLDYVSNFMEDENNAA